MKDIRLLKASEIDVRVGRVFKTGCTLLLYKDARVDMQIMDETFGAMNWQKQYSRDNANCTVSVWDEDKACWVSKEDTGTESYSEKEKGLASDSFKRACVCWGIGRELYTAPMLWVQAECGTKDGKYYLPREVQAKVSKLKCTDIQYSKDRCIRYVKLDAKGLSVEAGFKQQAGMTSDEFKDFVEQ